MKFIALGGNCEIGRNFYLLELENRIIILDCGIKIPTKDQYGVDYIISDISYLKNNSSKIVAFIISHGHEDSCGAFPYIIDNFPHVKVFVNKITKKSINDLIHNSKRWKLKKYNINYQMIESGNVYNITNDIKLEPFEVLHSYPQTFNYFIRSNSESILYLTDCIVSGKNNIWDKNFPSVVECIYNKKVDLLLMDSSLSLENGFCTPNYSIFNFIDNIYHQNIEKERFIIACYNDDIHYIHEVIKFCIKYKLSLYIDNISVYNLIKEIANNNYISIKNVCIIFVTKNIVPKNGVILIVKGVNSLFPHLYNITIGNNHLIKLNGKKDIFILCAKIAPGSELELVKILNEMAKNSVDSCEIPSKTIKSLHPCREDISLMFSIAKPNFVIPIKGTYSQLMETKNIACQYINPKNVIFAENGKIISIDCARKNVTMLPHKINCKDVYIDGTGIGDVSNMVVYERQIIGNNGIIIVSFNVKDSKISSNININMIGFLSEKNNEMKVEMEKEIIESVNSLFLETNVKDINVFRHSLQRKIGKYLWQQVKKEPVIIPVIINK